MKARLVALSLCSLLLPSLARADTLAPGSNDYGSITHISRGIKELSLELGFVFNQRTDKEQGALPKTSSTALSALGAPVFRYFLADNFALGLHVGGFYRSVSTKVADAESKTSEVGGLGLLSGAYYAKLGGGLFLAPLVGVGGFFGNSDTTAAGSDVKAKATIVGAAVRGGLGLVFYTSKSFNLFARPEATVYIGSSKPKDDPAAGAEEAESRGFTRIDGGFTCGASYVF